MRLLLDHISKRYPAVLANDDIHLEVAPGEIHAILGENGAGKSTLMKIIHGEVQPDGGSIQWDGQDVRIASPAAAQALGIAMVHQHFALFDTLTVAENIALGLARSVKVGEIAAQLAGIAARYGLALDAHRPVHTLSVGERQQVEIARALLAKPRLLILDEPTSVLTPQAVARLFDTLRLLAAEGCSILYISHKLEEIRTLCQRCTVLRGGRVAGACDPRETSAAELSRMMVGSALPPANASPGQAGAALLEVRALSLARSHPFGTDLRAIDLTLHAGAMLGIAGVSGNGQQELLAALCGEDSRAPHDSIQLDGRALGKLGPAARRAAGLGFIPEERLGRGTVPAYSLAANVMLTDTARPLLLPHAALRERAAAIIARFKVKAGGAEARADSLSGGNLQKYLVGREVLRAPRVLLVAQPTWGVDVAAAAQIHAELRALRDAGCAILVVSEELDELFALCDTLQVMAGGRLSAPLPTHATSVAEIGQLMGGGLQHA